MNKEFIIDYEREALLWAEKYGVIEYKIKHDKMIFISSWPCEHNSYKCIVNLNTGMEEPRQLYKYYYKHSGVNICA